MLIRVVAILSLFALAGCAERRAAIYVDQLADPSRKVREEASHKLVEIGRSAVKPLIARATAGSDSLQYISAQILGQIGDRRAIPFLRQLSQSSNLHVRQKAVLALGMMDDVSLLKPLLQILASDPDTTIRRTAAYSVGNLRDTSAVAPLIEALADPSAVVRKHVLAALNRLWTSAARKATIKALQDADGTVRYIAAQMLGNHRAHQGVEPLRAALRDPNVWVRTEAARALGLIGDDSVVEDLENLLQRNPGPDHEAARQALRTLTGMDYVILD